MKPSNAVLPLALLVLASAYGCNNSEAATTGLPKPSGSGAPELPQLATLDDEVAANAATADATLRATGSTFAIEQAELGPKSSGVLASVRVDEGDKVKKGQLLFTLDAAQPALAVEQAKAALQAAEVARARAQLEFDRTQPLHERGVVSPAIYDQVRMALAQADVGVAQAKVAVSTAKRSLADTAVVSPLNGVVAQRLKSPGETVTMMPPTTVLVIQDLSKIEVRVDLPERALGQVKAGDPMSVRFRALDETIQTPVTRINPSVNARSRTIEVISEIENPAGKYRAGMLVECSFESTAEEASAATEATSAAPAGSALPVAKAAKAAQEPAEKP